MLPRALSASGKRLTKFRGGSWECASGRAQHLGVMLLWRLLTTVESQQGRLGMFTLSRLVKDESS